MGISRRDFLKWTGVMGLSAGVSGIMTKDLFAFRKAGPGEGYYLPTETRFSMCGTCDNNCGVTLHLADGVVKEITGNLADTLQSGGKGRICVKGQSAMRNLYDPDLLKVPLKRTNPVKGINEDPGFVQISWDEAFNLISGKMQEAINIDGPKSIVFLARPKESDMHFVQSIGTPNQVCHVDTCYINYDASWTSILGTGKSRTFEMENSTYILGFGYDIPGKSKMAQLNGLLEAKARGSKVVIFDPRLSVTASYADEWFAIKPGTDLAVTLAMINVIINENLYDNDYVNSYCYGFDKLVNHVSGYTPGWAENISGIPAGDIERIAIEFAGSERPLIPTYKRDAGGPVYGNSFGLAHAIAILCALVGSYERPGGYYFPRKPSSSPSLSAFAPGKVNYPERDGSVRIDGQHLFPVMNGAFGGIKSKGNFSHLADGLRLSRLGLPFPDGTPSYPVRVIFAHNYNTHSFPNPEKIITELCQPDRFLAVYDTIPNNLAWLADVVLPGTWWMEDKNSYGTTDQHALWPTLKLKDGVGALWERKGYGAVVNGILEKLYPGQFNIDWKTLNLVRARNVVGVNDPVAWLKANNGIWENRVYPPVPKNLAALKTPSGKIELYSQKLAANGHEPLPVWHPKLTTLSAPDEFYVVTHHNPYQRMNKNCNDYLIMDLQNENFLHMNEGSAQSLGISSGDYVWVLAQTGKQVKIRVMVTKGIRPDTVMIEHGYGHFSKLTRVAYGKGVNDGDLLPDRQIADSLKRYKWSPSMPSALCDTKIRFIGKA
jgi:thiosulfate reductase/polysulfide reductase chain A